LKRLCDEKIFHIKYTEDYHFMSVRDKRHLVIFQDGY